MNKESSSSPSGKDLPPEFRQVIEARVAEHFSRKSPASQIAEGSSNVRKGAHQLLGADSPGLLDSALERAKTLQVVEMHIDPETPEGQRMIRQIGVLHDECCIPKEVLLQFRQGGDKALRDAFKHGGMPDAFHPSPAEEAIYRKYQPGYLSPRDMFLHQLSGDRPGDFHVLALVDSSKNPQSELEQYMQGYITFRLPPQDTDPQNVLEYISALEETLAVRVGSNLGLPTDMKYEQNWNMQHMHDRLKKTLELDTIIVKRGNRKCGGALMLIDALDKFVVSTRGSSVTKVYCSVFAGFTDTFTTHEQDDDDDYDPNLPSLAYKPVGRNIGSADFFERDLLFTQFAVRRTPTEVIVRDLGDQESHDYQVFEPHWGYLYNSLKRIRRQLAQSEILKQLGRR